MKSEKDKLLFMNKLMFWIGFIGLKSSFGLLMFYLLYLFAGINNWRLLILMCFSLGLFVVSHRYFNKRNK